MLDDPLAGRALRVPDRSRLLVATADGIFLWPGTALVYRRGNGFFAMEPRAVNSAVGCLFGPAAIELPLQAILERARDELRNGRIAVVQELLDHLPLPLVSPNGARLMRAIAERQGSAMPRFPVVTHQDGTIWSERDVSFFARLYDSVAPEAQRLDKIFNPGSAWDPAKHPRWPRGESDGGEFAPAGGGSDSPIIPVAGPPPPWHNNPPERVGDPPEIPKTEPGTTAAKFLAIRTVVYWLGTALKFGSTFAGQIKALTTAAQIATWLWPYVSAFLDKPKSLEELQAGANSPSIGYDIHHIVEQTPADQDGYSQRLIESPLNKVKIPTVKHWELNAWFNSTNNDYGGQTPRQYVRDKPWLERRRVGLDGLREVGVLKR